MKDKRNLLKSKKGVSTMFIAIYGALLTIILVSSLFVATGIFQSSLADSLRLDQKRQQEKILISGPDGMTYSEADDVVQTLRVENLGAITVRIKALYIAGQFICDPSKFTGDSYIEPSDTVWLNLADAHIVLNDETINGFWTLMTERGTKSSETGANIIYGPPDGPPTANKFYFGPLMIIFDRFQWRSGTGAWHDGWTIPTSTSEVTWRILLSNVDERSLTVRDTSFFSLVGTQIQSNKVLDWYIDPNLSSLEFKPGRYYFVYFTLSKPFSEGGRLPTNAQSITGMPGETICTNFLLFSGHFNAPGNPPFGQTIPFEAVLIKERT